MAFLEGILGTEKEFHEEDFIEIEPESVKRGEEIPIRIVKLNEYGDADKVQKALRDGSVVFVKIKTLKEKDMTELKRAIERLRKTVSAVSGDIAGVDENYLIVTPSYAKIMRGEEQPQKAAVR